MMQIKPNEESETRPDHQPQTHIGIYHFYHFLMGHNPILLLLYPV